MDELVTVAVFHNAIEAGRAKELLGYVGIHSVAQEQSLTEEIRLEVAQGDYQAALDLLDQKTWQTRNSKEEKTSFPTVRTGAVLPASREEDEPEKGSAPREKLATRTFKVAIFGLLCPVLLPIAYCYFGRLCFSKGELQGRPRYHARIAALILGGILLFLLILFVGILVPRSNEVDLRDLPHPAVLVGNWAGKVDPDKEIDIDIGMRSNGNVHYQVSGPTGIDATGTWAYTNHTLYLRLDRFQKGTSPWKGKIIGWPMEQFTNDEMILTEQDSKLRLLRQR